MSANNGQPSVDPLVELLLELGARAKQAERTVQAQAKRIEDLESQVSKKEEKEKA